MNDKNKNKGQSGSKPAGSNPLGSKRPYSTIDLKATEVVSDSAAKDAKSASGASSGAGASTTGAGSTAVPPAGSVAKPSDAASGSAASKPPSGSVPPAAPTSSASSAGSTKSTASSAGSASGSSTASGSGKTPVPPPKAKSSGGFGSFISHMFAGIIGAGLTLLGANFAGKELGLTGMMPGASAPAAVGVPAEVTNRIAALEKSLAGGAAAGNSVELNKQLAAAQERLAKLEALGGDVEKLNAEQAKLRSDAEAMAKRFGPDGPTQAAVSRLEQLEQTLAALGAAAKSDPNKAGRIPQLAQISGRVNDLETALKNRIAALRSDVLQEVDQRVAATRESSEAAKSGAQRLDRDVAGLRTNTAKIDQRLIELKSGTDVMQDTLRVLQQDTGSLKTSLSSLEKDVADKFKSVARPADVSAAVGPVAKKLASLEDNLQGVVQSEQDRKATAERIVLALELGNLKRAMDRGQGFKPELAEVKRVSGGKIDLSALEAHQSTGVPSLGELQSSFRPISYKMIDSTTIKDNASVMDRLLHGAKSMVRIRKVNHSPDDTSVEAIVGRMDEALKDGRLSDVLKETEKLPAKALAPAADWMKKLKARQSVDQALATIEAKLKSSLGGKPAGEKG